MTHNPKIKKILLVDGNNYLYRIYFALNKVLKNDAEKNDNLILHSLIFNLEKLLVNLNIDYCFFAFDYQKKTFRNDIYLDYKKDRPKMPEKLFLNMQIFEEYLTLRDISIKKQENYEADDVIASLISSLQQENFLFYILSSDVDICQLICENVIYLNISQKILNPDFWDKNKFFEKFNFYPSQIIDFKAIVGDASDNIKGIEKVGKTTATKLLTKFLSIENIFSNIDNLNEKIKNIFLMPSTKEILIHNKRLITLVTDLYKQNNQKIILKSSKITQDLFIFLAKYQLKKITDFLNNQIKLSKE